MIELCEIPAGPFLMGSSDADGMAFSDEKPQHEVTLPAFKIGKYPVTNRQYAAFVGDGGYDERRYWTKDGWASKRRGGWAGPREYGTPFNWPNHPVVGVSWYEAVAFCHWLTEVWRAEGRIGEDEVVRLPSEAEWEKAARGDDGRRYPWGDDPDPNKANYIDTDIDSTSVVGHFPGGVSPYGCQDMSGNVDEWTRSTYKPYPYDPNDGREGPGGVGVRVVRGGAFYYMENYVRCAGRYGYSTGGRYSHLGFRVVVAVAA